jgi:hypothetical protein
MSREQELLTQFSQKADTIQADYKNIIAGYVSSNGARPPYEELLDILKKMDAELTKSGVAMVEQYQSDGVVNISTFITDIKNKIASTIEQFVKTL